MADARILIAARNRTVAVEHGRIVPAEGDFDMVLEFPDADVRPGLINGHDHLHRNHYGRLGDPPYANAYQWARDIQTRHRRRIDELRRVPRRQALLAGAWKNLFAGVTSVVHHDAWEPDFERDFPLCVLRVANADLIGMTPALDAICGRPACLHVGEGVDAGAADEVRTLERKGLLTAALIAVHGVGLDEDAIERFRAAGAALVWCPTSNFFLFGRTAPAALLREGTDVLIGSDSLLTGAGDLLDELRCARAHGALDDARLEQAVGATAARRLGLAEPSLQPGAPADLILVSRPILEAQAEDIALVMVGGTPRVARPDVATRLNGLAEQGEERKVGSVIRWTNARPSTAPKGRSLR